MTETAPQPQPPAAPPNTEELQAKFGELYQQIAQSPNDPDLRVKLAYVSLDLGRRNEAINAFVRALQIDPSLAFIRARLQSICTPDELKMYRVPEDVVPFWQDLPGLFAYPVRGNGLGILIVGSVFFAIAGFVSNWGGVWGWAAGLITTGYLAAYYVNVIKTSGVGQKSPPDWPDLSHPADMVGFGIQWILAGAAAFFPAILITLFVLPEMYNVLGFALLGMSALLGIFVYPMAILTTALYGSVGAAFNYPFVVNSIMRIMREYVMAWVCLLVLAIAVTLLFLLGMALNIGAALAGGTIGGELIGVVILFLLYQLIVAAVSLYGYMVFCRLLGQVYYFSQRKLGWFEG
ncbi:MAG: DUF4013 domain-containing protein [Planctomycetes bacterium]|nr:DUF4013 domain-containing protein [Planctomycetota bacterium]